jgi:hypothetical protein
MYLSTVLICLFLSLSLPLCFSSPTSSSSTIPWMGHYTLDVNAKAQVILGIGYEIQSDSIGSGNEGLPDYLNTSVPYDLLPSEKKRFFSEMLTGFRFCRLALGLYFRGTTSDGLNIIERFEGQADGLAEMAQESGIEGFEVEYWSPPPGWKSNNKVY